jgi:hypothetical protein
MTTMLNPGRVERKQLGDQIDRLDAILDGLADGLNDAVRDATREAAQVAVHQVMLEILSNPTTISMLRDIFANSVKAAPAEFMDLQSTPTVVVEKPSWLSRLKRGVLTIKDKIVNQIQTTTQHIVATVRTGIEKVSSLVKAVQTKAVQVYTALQIGWQIKRAILVGVGTGTLALGISCFSHTAAMILGGVATGASAFGIQMALLLRKKIKALQLL